MNRPAKPHRTALEAVATLAAGVGAFESDDAMFSQSRGRKSRVTHDIHLEPNASAHETARSLVMGGAENGSCRFFREGRHVMSHASLYRCAATTVREEPTLSTVRWHPHPKAVVPERLREVVAAEHAAMDAARVAKRKAA